MGEKEAELPPPALAARPALVRTESDRESGTAVMTDANAAAKFAHLHRLLSRGSPFADADAFDPGPRTLQYLHECCRVLVIGAGGLGCEILKDLALSGFMMIHIVDMDTIDLSNLNRQFLFRQADVGRPKAEVAAEFINRRLGHTGLRVVPHVCKMEHLGEPFFARFNIIIAGLDSISARRWLSATLYGLVETSKGAVSEADPSSIVPLAAAVVDPGTIIPLLDGGTEGFSGQARVILPRMTSCFECSVDTFPPQVNYPLCTIAETPRLPEHCVEYAFTVLWGRFFPERKFAADSAADVMWVHEQAVARAEQFGIRGVTLQLTLGVVKRIIPAIASTNALVSAALVSEALKIATYCGPVLNNYMMYMGQSGVYTHTFEFARREDCLVCGGGHLTLERPASSTLQELLDALAQHASYQLSRPSISCTNGVVFLQDPQQLRAQHEYKLPLTLRELTLCHPPVLQEGQELLVTDPSLPSQLTLNLKLL